MSKRLVLFAVLYMLTVLILLEVKPEPMDAPKPPAPAPATTCADGAMLAALLNQRRVGLGDGSYATCRIHNLPKGEHIHESL